MRFQVPQFIETESKIIGPFTLKQFIYIAIGAILVFLLRYVLTSFMLWITLSLAVMGLAAALAFYKINGIPLPRFILMALSFGVGPKQYLFKEGAEDTNPRLPGSSQP